MVGYHKFRVEIEVRCAICDDIERYIESQRASILKNNDLLSHNAFPSALKLPVEDDNEALEARIEIARRVIDEIMMGLKGRLI